MRLISIKSKKRKKKQYLSGHFIVTLFRFGDLFGERLLREEMRFERSFRFLAVEVVKAAEARLAKEHVLLR